MIGPRPRVLLAEDDAGLSEVVRALLTQENYAVTRVDNGADVLRVVREERPDLVLLDVLLPGMSGFEVCQRLRQDPSTCLIPIILVTALGNTKDKVTGFKLGADEYLVKPFDAMELLARVDRLLRQRREEMSGNPLTGLPGGPVAEAEIQKRLQNREPFTLARADITGLAAFNRAYGFERGDHVIRLVAMILRSAALELGNSTDVVAHLGGDDFVFISTAARADVVAARALENAEILLLMQYDEKDRVASAAPVSGAAGWTPIITLSMGLVDVAPGDYAHHVPLMDRAALAVAEAKKAYGNHLARLAVPPAS